jgi:hypothetical protein
MHTTHTRLAHRRFGLGWVPVAGASGGSRPTVTGVRHSLEREQGRGAFYRFAGQYGTDNFVCWRA